MDLKSIQQYHPLPEDEDSLQASHLKPKSSKDLERTRRYILLGLSLITIILLAFTLIVVHRRHQPSWESCGTTPESARQRGCSFDLISFAWQTPECYDSSLNSEFAEWEEWSYYTDRRGNDTVPQSVALLGEQTLWVSWHFHLVHCTFIWRQMHRAFERGWIDTHLRVYDHTVHCQEMLLKEGLDNDAYDTNATVIYPVCQRVRKSLGWWD